MCVSGGTPGADEPPPASTPSQLQRLRKRKLRGGDAALHKRRSSVGDAVLLSLSGNLLDCTPSPDGKQLLEGMLMFRQKIILRPESLKTVFYTLLFNISLIKLNISRFKQSAVHTRMTTVD